MGTGVSKSWYISHVSFRPPKAWKAHSRHIVIPNEPGGMKTKVEMALHEVRGFLKSVEK